MKFKPGFVFAMALGLFTAVSLAQAQDKPETLGDKLKKLFVRPTPKSRAKSKVSPTPTPTETPASETAQPGENPESTPAETVRPSHAGEGATQYFEPVRPINPGPRSHRRAIPRTTPTPEATIASTETPTAGSTEEASASPAPSPTLTPLPTETPQTRPMPSLPPLIKVSPTPIAKKSAAAPRVISLGDIAESASYSPELKKLLELGLDLSARNLRYKYVSADPANGGMDSSGFIYYVLTNSGIPGVPRDARDQYIWVRKAGTFQAVLAQRDDSFELDGLKPGDLLFWSSNYGMSADPEITQTMIYMGRDKVSKQRLMIGAQEAGTFGDNPRSGVGVFDFKIGRSATKSNKEAAPVFVGYGHIPTANSQ